MSAKAGAAFLTVQEKRWVMKGAMIATVLLLCPGFQESGVQTIRVKNREATAVGLSVYNVKTGGKDAVTAVKDAAVKGVDEPVFSRINGVDLKNGPVEPKMPSRMRRR